MLKTVKGLKCQDLGQCYMHIGEPQPVHQLKTCLSSECPLWETR